MGIFIILFDNSIIGIFTNDPQVSSAGTICLRILTFGIVIYGWGMVVIQAFNGAGDTMTPLWINIISFWLIKLSLAYAFAKYLDWGPDGIWFAVALAYSLHAVFAMILFRLGRWKLRKI